MSDRSPSPSGYRAIPFDTATNAIAKAGGGRLPVSRHETLRAVDDRPDVLV